MSVAPALPSTLARVARRPTAIVASAVTVLGLLPYTVGTARLPLGPDASVYLWWFRLTGLDGLSAVSRRPGAIALMRVGAGAFAGDAAAVIAIEVAAAVGIAVGITLLARHAGVRTDGAQVAAGVLAGFMALGLSEGWISNAAFGVCYLAAIVLLLREDTVAWVGPGVALGAAAVCHPQFFVLGAGVLAIVAVIEFLRGMRRGARQIVASLALGTALGALGLGAMSIGSTWSTLPTSGDGLFRAAGLQSYLPERFRQGFEATWLQHGLWLVLPIPLLLLGLARGRGGRIAGTWVAVCILGIPVLLATGVAPATRLPQWAFPLPIFLALGWERATRGGFPPPIRAILRVGLAVGAVGLAVAAATVHPDFTSEDRANIERAWSATSADAEPGRPLVGVLGYEPIQPANLTVEVWNELRATLPADRSGNAFAFYGTADDLTAGRALAAGDTIDRALSRYTGRVIEDHGGVPLVLGSGTNHEPSQSVGVTGTPPPSGLLEEAPASGVVLAVLTSLIVWLLIGSARAGGSAQRAIDEGSANLLVGAVALVWASLAMDRLGLPPSGRWVIPLTWALAAAIAWGIGWIDRRSETA